MREQLPPPSSENNFQGHLSEGMLSMMHAEAAILSYTIPESEADFSEEKLIAFARKVEAHSEVFTELFTNKNFHPAARFTNLAPLIKTSLLTAPYLVAQNTRDYSGNLRFRRELSVYNRSLGDAIRANPDMTMPALMAILNASLDWARLPSRYRRYSESALSKTITGVSAELIAEQLFDAANIQYELTSVEDDLNHIDFKVKHPQVKDHIEIDIKNSPEQVRTGPINPTEPVYRITRDSCVILCTGAVPTQGRLQLNPHEVEQKNTALRETIDVIARKLDYHKQERQRRQKETMEFNALATRLAMMYSDERD